VLTAECGGRTVAAEDVTDRHAPFCCPDCETRVIPKLGEEVIWHFAHRPDPDRTCTRAGESIDHMRTKLSLARQLTAAGYDIQVEAKIGRGRRLDLAVRSPKGRWCAIEIQVSPIPVPEMKRRIAADRAAGATDTMWVWVGRLNPHDGAHGRPWVRPPDEIAYQWHRTWTSLSLVRYGQPWLAPLTRIVNPDTGRTSKRDFWIEQLPAQPTLVVARGRFGPVVRFKAAASPTVVDTIAPEFCHWEPPHQHHQEEQP
jgi:hypothetical protein